MNKECNINTYIKMTILTKNYLLFQLNICFYFMLTT